MSNNQPKLLAPQLRWYYQHLTCKCRSLITPPSIQGMKPCQNIPQYRIITKHIQVYTQDSDPFLIWDTEDAEPLLGYPPHEPEAKITTAP